MRSRVTVPALLALAFAVLGLVSISTTFAQPPLAPTIYLGRVFIQLNVAPDGLIVFACVDGCAEGYRSEEVVVESGRYFRLIVGPTDRKYIGKKVTFLMTAGAGDVQAVQTDTFQETSFPLLKELDLRFTEPPPIPTPTPTPTYTPTPTPTPSPTPPPIPTPTPTPTPSLPIVGDPTVSRLPGLALMAGLASLAAGVLLLLLVRRRTS